MLILLHLLAIWTEFDLFVAPALAMNLFKLSQKCLSVQVGFVLHVLRHDALLVIVLLHIPLG